MGKITREEIEKMQEAKDRDLDTEVALRVMGWTPDRSLKSDDSMPIGFWRLPNGVAVVEFAAWQPTNDAEDMLMVVYEMIDRHEALTFRVDTLIPNSDAPVFYVDFDGSERLNDACSDFSLLRAVCKAALYHVGGNSR